MNDDTLFPDLAPVEIERPRRAAKPAGQRREAEQFTLDFKDEDAAFELRLRDQYAANKAAQDAYWGPDRYVIHWVYGCHAREEWEGLPEYERNRWRMWHAVEQDRVDHGGRMNTAAYVHAINEEAFQRDKQTAERWAEELKTAFLEGKPCPIWPLPGLFGNEWILRWAFNLAHVNPASLPEAEEVAA